MPYSTNAELPEGVKGLPEHAQDIFRAAYNSAEKQYKGSENDARRAKIAWAAVKQSYEQDADGNWKAKDKPAEKLMKTTLVDKQWEIFVPLSKYDPINGDVEGYAFVEQPDHSGEIIDYSKSLPYFLGWSQAAQKRSNGKSKGNLREMHRNSAAGILTDLTPDDAKKGLYIKTRVIDPVAKTKVESGTYTGFSIGGDYVSRYPDPLHPGLTRYVANPVEISLVDAPCIPDASFKAIKNSGERLELFKAVSLDDLAQETRGAWYDQFAPRETGTIAPAGAEYVLSVLTDSVITCEDGKYYRYPYLRDSAGVHFTGDRQEVTQEWLPAGSDSLSSLSSSSSSSSSSSNFMPHQMELPDIGKMLDARIERTILHTLHAALGKQTQPNVADVPDANDEPVMPMEVARQPLDRAANPFNPAPIDPYTNPPPAPELAGHGDPAQDVSSAANQIASASALNFAKRGDAPYVDKQPTGNRAAAETSKLKIRKRKGVKVMANKEPTTAAAPTPAAPAAVKRDTTPYVKDAASVLQQAQSLVGSIRDQASQEGQIDQDKLDQLAAALAVTMDQAEDANSEAESDTHNAASSLGTETATASNPIDSTATTPTETGSSKSSDSSSSSSSSSSESTPGKHTPSSMESDTMIKADEPFSTTPPQAALQILSGGNVAETLVPQMIEALARNQLAKARALCSEDGGNGVKKFNEALFNDTVMMSLHTVANQLGFTQRNYPNLLRKLGQYTDSGSDEDLGNGLKKAITASGVPGINLLPLARLMLPVYSGLGRRLPIAQPKDMGSNQATWRTQIGFGTFDEVSAMSVAESSIGSAMGEAFLTFQTAYRDTTVNDKASLKSLAASRGYDDPLQVATINALAAMLRVRERNLLGSNAAALADPTSVTSTPAGSGTLGNSDDKFTVTALTYRGWFNYVTNGLIGTDGSITPIGETVGTTSSTTNLSAALTTVVTWPIVKGAVAYALYYLPHGVVANGHIVGVYLVNTATVTTVPGSGNKAPTADTSVNANGYEGLVSWCELTTIYSQTVSTLRTLTDNAGAGLTTGNGGITQFNTVLRQLWTNWQIAPTLMVMSPTMVQTVTAKLLALNSAALYRIEVQQERGTITGGAFVTSIVNQFAPMIDGSPRSVEIMGHPYFPDGTVLFVSETVPYALSRTANAFQAEQLVPFTYFPLAQTTLDYPFAVTLSEVLECFHPSAQAAIAGIDVAL